MNDHAMLFKIGRQCMRDVFILERQNTLFLVDQVDLGAAIIGKNGRELTADHASAENDDTSREIRQ